MLTHRSRFGVKLESLRAGETTNRFTSASTGHLLHGDSVDIGETRDLIETSRQSEVLFVNVLGEFGGNNRTGSNGSGSLGHIAKDHVGRGGEVEITLCVGRGREGGRERERDQSINSL